MRYGTLALMALAGGTLAQAGGISILPSLLQPRVQENNHPSDRPAIQIHNRTMVYSTNGSIFSPPELMPMLGPKAVLDLGRKVIQSQQQEYFVVKLGTIANSTWDTQLYEDFTTVIDNAHFFPTLVGFVIQASLEDHNLPFFKAAVRDMKKYLVRNRMRYIPIGLELTSHLNTTADQYFACNTLYPVDFYYSNQAMSFPSPRSGSCPEDMTFCTTSLPHTPRASRCDCIMSALRCMINPKKVNQEFNELERFCDTVYCGSIENDVEQGRYGIFASCTKLQRHSIALNLYYSYHGNQASFCHAGGLGKLVAHNYSIENYQSLYDYNGKSCRQEIVDDWDRYLIGRARKQITSGERDTVNEDIDNEIENAFLNSAGRTKCTGILNMLMILILISI
ncbi:hypothetical protein KL912_002715 [Ogataea haglerorum]|nr:hypothetical protein KL912_002715 [Ogataea haglerorum]